MSEQARTHKVGEFSLAYFDTNIYISILKKPTSFQPVRNYLMENNFALAVSDVNILELAEKEQSHVELARFLLGAPSVLLKTTETLKQDEISSYGTNSRIDPLIGPISPLVNEVTEPIELLANFFHDDVVREFRAAMTERKPLFEKRINETLANFEPLTEPDRFSEEDGPFYALHVILHQVLIEESPIIARKVLDDMKALGKKAPGILRSFPGLWVSTLAQFYRYYMHCRPPHGNDYGDFMHIYPIPYCSIAFLEKDLAQDLNHMRKFESLLQATEVYDIAFLRSVTGTSI